MKPQLPSNVEEKLAPIDRRAAEGYTAVEDVVAAIDKGLAEGVISVTLEVTDTVIHRLVEAQAAAAPDEEEDEEKK